MIYIVQHRRGTTEQWQQSDIIPDDGEIVIERCDDQTSHIKLGDGKNTFANLPYITSTNVDGVDGLLYENNFLYLTSDGVIVSDPVEIKVEPSEDVSDRVAELEKNMADLLYTPISITSFSHNAGTRELGSKLDAVTLSWKINKTPTALTLKPPSGATPSLSAEGSVALSGLGLTSTTTWTLTATDDRDAIATKTATVTFCNRVCYGVAAAPDTIDSDFVMSLATKNLATSRTNSGVKYNAGEGQYLWYCVPTRLGQCAFTDVETGLGAGLALAATISVTNASGYSENYYVYKSDYAGLGSLTVKVS